MFFGPSTLGAWANTRLESRIKKFTPHSFCRYALPLMFGVILALVLKASNSLIDLDFAPYVLYGVKYNGLVSLAPFSYIALASYLYLITHQLTWITPRTFCIVLNILA